jgi:hypothetical protein
VIVVNSRRRYSRLPEEFEQTSASFNKLCNPYKKGFTVYNLTADPPPFFINKASILRL